MSDRYRDRYEERLSDTCPACDRGQCEDCVQIPDDGPCDCPHNFGRRPAANDEED